MKQKVQVFYLYRKRLKILRSPFAKFSIFFGIFCFLLHVQAVAHAEILEVDHFQELVHYVDADTLVIVDIDDTLLVPVQTLGTDIWFQDKLNTYKQVIKDPAVSLDKILAEWEAIRHLTQVRIVEEGSDEIIADLQKKNVPIMGLTTQGLALATRTVVQLQSLNIDLSKTSPASEDHYFINGSHGVLYRKGILFTSGTGKGDALFHLFDLMRFYPKKIVFINDKQANLKDVERTAFTKGIDFTGLRYSYSDERVAAYNPAIAEIQWNHSTFGHILSDEDARAKLIFDIFDLDLN